MQQVNTLFKLGNYTNLFVQLGFKGTWTRLVKFVYNFFLPQTVIHQQYEAIFIQNDHFQTHCALNRATCGI